MLVLALPYGLATFAVPSECVLLCFNGEVHIGQHFHFNSVLLPHSLQNGIVHEMECELVLFPARNTIS